MSGDAEAITASCPVSIRRCGPVSLRITDDELERQTNDRIRLARDREFPRFAPSNHQNQLHEHLEICLPLGDLHDTDPRQNVDNYGQQRK